MRSVCTHFNSKAALNNNNFKKPWKYKARSKYSKKWFSGLSFQIECIKAAGKSSIAELNKDASLSSLHLSSLHIKWENTELQLKKSTITLLCELKGSFQQLRSVTSNQRKFKEFHPELTVVSTVCVDIEKHALRRSQSQNKLVNPTWKLL